jgi:hypothetical protein
MHAEAAQVVASLFCSPIPPLESFEKLRQKQHITATGYKEQHRIDRSRIS